MPREKSIYKWNEESPDNRTNYPNISTAIKIKPKLYYFKKEISDLLKADKNIEIRSRKKAGNAAAEDMAYLSIIK